MKEHSLWRMHCKWTRWDDFCALRSLIHHLHCTQTLTTLNLSGQQDRRWRSTVFGECIASEHGETTFVRFDHLFTTFIAHRHSQRWILVAEQDRRWRSTVFGECNASEMGNALQVNTVRRLLCASITYSPPSLHTDTHNAGSSTSNNIGDEGAQSLANASPSIRGRIRW